MISFFISNCYRAHFCWHIWWKFVVSKSNSVRIPLATGCLNVRFSKRNFCP